MQTVEQKVMRAIASVSLIIPIAVGLLMAIPEEWKQAIGISEVEGMSNLPLFHAGLNGTTFVLLVFAGWFAKQKKIQIHKMLMLSAFVLSSIFLLSYVLYHLTHASAHFGGEGAIKFVYFFILITHIVLSIPVIPLALVSMYRGLINDRIKHRGIVRIAYPVWLYVSFTGVLVYIFMQPYY